MSCSFVCGWTMDRKAILSWTFLLCLCVMISSAAGANTVLKGKCVCFSFIFFVCLQRFGILTARGQKTTRNISNASLSCVFWNLDLAKSDWVEQKRRKSKKPGFNLRAKTATCPSAAVLKRPAEDACRHVRRHSPGRSFGAHRSSAEANLTNSATFL